MTESAVSLEVARLADQLERSFRGGAWHGLAVLESLEGIDPTAAAARPVAGAHSIWEIAGHTGVWMRIAARRIRGEVTTGPSEEENFPFAGDHSERAWRDLLAELDAAYKELLEALRGLEDGNLGDPVSGSDPTVRGLVLGVIQHNAYHAGQIVVLARALEMGREGS